MSRTLRRIGLFLVGLLLITLGLVLIVLPGRLTIPPILLGQWLWSREFEFARRWLRPVSARGSEAWAAAKARPVHTTVVSALGLVCAGIALWLVLSYDVLDRGRELVGLG